MLFSDSTRSVREQLGDTHRAVLSALEGFVAASPGVPLDRTERWEAVADQIVATMDAEERELLPGFLESHERDARAILREHHDLRLRIAAVRTLLTAGSETTLRSELESLLVSLRAHTAHEARLLYAWVEDRDLSRP